MQKRTLITGLGAAVLVVGSATGVAVAASGHGRAGDDKNTTVTGPQAKDATKAALKLTGGGTANSVERDSENGATWEVEVTRPDDSVVDVRLDQDFQKVVIEGDQGK